MQPSNLYLDLRKKYATKRFLAFIEAGKETVWAFLSFLVFTATIAYFSTHFLLWLTGYYDTTAHAQTLTHHIVTPNHK